MSDRTQSFATHTAERKDMITSVTGMLDRQEEKFSGILPSNVRWKDFRNAFLVAVQINPRLLEADRNSLWLSLQKAASDGLKPDGREGALVIFGDEEEDEEGNRVASQANKQANKPKRVVWMPMVWGICKQMRNTGQIASIRAKLIYRGERVVITDRNGEETYEHVRVIGGDQQPIDEREENIVGAYAVVTYKDGFYDAEFMSRKQLDRIAATSRAKNGPWKSFKPQMMMKTPLRRLSLRVEKSAENERYFDTIQNDPTLIEGEVEDVTANAIADEFTAEKPQEKAAPAKKSAAPPKPFSNENPGGIARDLEKAQAEIERLARFKPASDTERTVPSLAPDNRVAPSGSVSESERKTHGSAALDADAAKLVAMGADPGPTVDEVFGSSDAEIWAVDEHGEPLESPEPMTPMQFANWFAGRLFMTKSPDALREHNMDAIGDAGADKEAARIITEALQRHARRAADAITAEITKPAEDAPKARIPIPLPKTPKGSVHVPNLKTIYFPAACAEIEKLKDEADIQDWLAVNRPSYRGLATEIAIDNRIAARRNALGGGPSPPATAEAEPLDARVRREIAAIDTLEGLQAWARGEIRPTMMGVKASDPALYSRITEILDEKQLSLEPKE